MPEQINLDDIRRNVEVRRKDVSKYDEAMADGISHEDAAGYAGDFASDVVDANSEILQLISVVEKLTGLPVASVDGGQASMQVLNRVVIDHGGTHSYLVAVKYCVECACAHTHFQDCSGPCANCQVTVRDITECDRPTNFVPRKPEEEQKC